MAGAAALQATVQRPDPSFIGVPAGFQALLIECATAVGTLR
jgi:hypothetical protein